jgi:nitroimidazol reductase NimA-like FMN-containing flavoprotein (pyridoxamine 5'-phosphate oxidase superfamily)
MGNGKHPRFRTLDREECEAILARNNVGRLAYAWHNNVDIEPLNYVYGEGWLYGRTSAGAKLQKTETTWWPVAFEVDEVEGLFRWRSVVVHGGFYALRPDGTDGERSEWLHAVELLRALIPETLDEGDPVPFRTLVFRMAAQEITGREATPADEPQAEAGDESGGEPSPGGS